MGRPGTKLWRLEKSKNIANDTSSHAALLALYSERLAQADYPEQAYRVAVPLEHRKRFGQFFTPVPIATLMVDWIKGIHPKTILDPAVGPGVFPRILLNSDPEAHFTCVDIDAIALNAARTALSNAERVTFVEQDFLLWRDEGFFDAAIGNPPYLRHHDLHYPFDIFYLVGKRNRAALSRLSNIYVLFVLEICRRLRAGGRAALIVPGEWVNANFGDELKYWLLNRGLLHTLIYFSHASTQFEEALTTASVLLIEKPHHYAKRELIRTIFVNDMGSLSDVHQALHSDPVSDANIVIQQFTSERLLEEKKWNHLLGNGSGRSFPGFVPLSQLANTRRGIATGANSFFHLTPSAVERLGIRSENLTPCVGRALDATGLIFRKEDFKELVACDGRTYLFDVQNEPNETERAYIYQGESDGLDKRYLCAARNGKWYQMERRPPSAIWATVFGRKGLRFIYNLGRVANLTTFHCIYPDPDSFDFAAALAACLNSRVVQNMARRQHRVYGGGLLKVEPKDLLDIEVPDLRRVSVKTLQELAAMLEKLDTAHRIRSDVEVALGELDSRVEQAAQEAAQIIEEAAPPNIRHRAANPHPQAQRRRRDGRAESHDWLL